MMNQDDIQEEIGYQLFARQDYLSEAFGDEARILDMQARDMWEEEQRLAKLNKVIDKQV